MDDSLRQDGTHLQELWQERGYNDGDIEGKRLVASVFPADKS